MSRSLNQPQGMYLPCAGLVVANPTISPPKYFKGGTKNA